MTGLEPVILRLTAERIAYYATRQYNRIFQVARFSNTTPFPAFIGSVGTVKTSLTVRLSDESPSTIRGVDTPRVELGQHDL